MLSTDMTEPWLDQKTIDHLLDDTGTWAVVGLSADPRRPAHGVARVLQAKGKRIVPIHPGAAAAGEEVLGEKAYATLAEAADAVGGIDVVDVFRRSEAAGEFADQAVAIGARGVWFQLGVVDREAFRRTAEAGVPMVMDTCPAIEWGKRGA
ncbi:CoA-binding protein [Nocardiopsis sp. CC223A]|uniref:CoA-binding protein n=1 Tax=Nocardiopsis sp. CC223A TaxID=3044051 RepID=UPI00278C8B40|nr:CoA-binding protein [Nocardiopsis sp. CC223A]